jgi:flagellin-like hook-associated protein FlgL
VVEANSSRVSVYLNQGDGTFGARTDLSLGNTRQGPSALADVNGDGRIDILQAYGTTTSSRVSVFMNQGSGSFAAGATYTLPSTALGGVSVADLNGDGLADFLAPISPSNTVAVALNAGNGTFGARVTYAVGTTPSSATSLADLNRDGRLDIVQTNTGAAGDAAENVSVLLNLGSGTFATQSTYAVGDNPRGSATLADVNGDGSADIVQSNYGSGTVSVLLNNGSGVFGSKSDYAVGTYPIGSTAVSDVNGDGHADLVQSNSASTISVLLNAGDGTFGVQTQYSSQNGSYAAHVTDLDRDGLNDILRAGSSSIFTTLTNQGAGSFASSTLSAKLTFSDARGTAKIQHVDLTTADSAREAMDTLEARAEKISRQRAVYGSVESRLKAAASVIDSTIINYRSAESRIKDTDVAEDAASLVRLNILKQVSASVLAQANLEPQIALRLLQGA